MPAASQRPQERTAENQDPGRKLDLKRQQLEETQRREKALQGDLAQLSDEREKLNHRLMETAGLIQRTEAQMSTIEARLGELESQEKMVRGSLERRHDSIAKLLSALQRMGRNPPPVMVTRREDALQMVRSAMLLAAAFPELRTQALELAGRLNELVRIMGDIRGESDRLKGETTRLNDARLRLAGLMEAKRQSQAERLSELNDVRKAAADIARNVSDLSELIQRLDKVVSERTGLGDYDKRVQEGQSQEQQPPALPTAAPGSPGLPKLDTRPPGEGEAKLAALVPPKLSPPPSVELAPSGGAIGSPGRLKPALPFHLAKGRLPMPAQGKRVLAFGDKTQFGGQSKGLVVETRHSAQITSPSDGWIVYAGPFRTYGQLLIINAGNGYHILLAGLSQIDVQLGQFVLAAEPVGTMTAAPKATGAKSSSSAPVLYVEFRKDGRPVDPAPWWMEGHQKVQG
jgi:septal ring factor EnvC (AmiA/AmiB activator)